MKAIYEKALVALPIAGMFIVPKIVERIPLKVRVRAVGGEKVIGKDYFKMAATVKNTGEVDITGYSLALVAEKPDGTGITINYVDFNLAVGEEKRFPATGYYEKQVPSDAPAGTYKAVALVFDDEGNEVARKVIDNAWEVREAILRVDITSVAVA